MLHLGIATKDVELTGRSISAWATIVGRTTAAKTEMVVGSMPVAVGTATVAMAMAVKVRTVSGAINIAVGAETSKGTAPRTASPIGGVTIAVVGAMVVKSAESTVWRIVKLMPAADGAKTMAATRTTGLRAAGLEDDAGARRQPGLGVPTAGPGGGARTLRPRSGGRRE